MAGVPQLSFLADLDTQLLPGVVCYSMPSRAYHHNNHGVGTGCDLLCSIPGMSQQMN